MFYFIIVYLIGFLASMIMFYGRNKKTEDYYSKIDLDTAIAISVLSWTVLIPMLLGTTWYQRINKKFMDE